MEDEFAERTYRLLNIKTASARDVESLQNWLDGTGCLARKESAYLEHNHDLASLASAGDTATLRIETWVEDRLIRFWPGYHKDRADSISNDSHVYLDVNPWVGQLARFLLLLVITLLLLMPAVICNMIDGLLVRMVVVVVFTMVYLAMLLTLIKSRTMELILAGAAYAAVLVVFVSGSDTLKTA
ncbi:uncharacterized protein CDV56_102179 [Aspergillus thermomutatus]|uniref:DUF6594 domain-containing protein n=1 Tax=Aspergillus thermomutatus TaxID=41047 RepID=A0A397HHD1_ASPTH|nr:uncharacterized protein CDV56_102179 [Aspergillus thermomutatus]RHZ62535.1 hypothetical protein CDV56_102179 [Aspergillus thermomutatus]